MNIEPEERTEPLDIQDEVTAAFDKAIEENPSNPDAAATDDTAIAAEVVAEPAKVEGEKEPEAAAPKEEAKPEPVDTDKEIATLGLKGRSAERFQHMAGEIKTLAPIKEALEKAGITDLADVPRIIERAQYADAWDEQIAQTNATPPQMTMAFDYLTNANAGTAGDLEAARKCFEYNKSEMKVWAKLLGEDMPGVVDPLEGQDDLKEALDNGEITRTYALQIAASRTQGNMATQRDAQTREENDSRQLFESGVTALNDLGDVLEKADPNYQAKLQYFMPIVKTIRDTCHPSEWAKRSRDAYLQIPEPVIAAPAARSPTPIRPAGLAPGLMPVTDDPVEAFDLGVAAANGM